LNLSWEFCAPNFYDFEAASGGGSPGADAWFDSSETKGVSIPTPATAPASVGGGVADMVPPSPPPQTHTERNVAEAREKVLKDYEETLTRLKARGVALPAELTAAIAAARSDILNTHRYDRVKAAYDAVEMHPAVVADDKKTEMNAIGIFVIVRIWVIVPAVFILAFVWHVFWPDSLYTATAAAATAVAPAVGIVIVAAAASAAVGVVWDRFCPDSRGAHGAMHAAAAAAWVLFLPDFLGAMSAATAAATAAAAAGIVIVAVIAWIDMTSVSQPTKRCASGTFVADGE
jgi:hypothetical protein